MVATVRGLCHQQASGSWSTEPMLHTVHESARRVDRIVFVGFDIVEQHVVSDAAQLEQSSQLSGKLRVKATLLDYE
jgi:hypothetical protein